MIAKMLLSSLLMATALLAMSASAAPKEPKDDINVPEFVQEVIDNHPVVIFRYAKQLYSCIHLLAFMCLYIHAANLTAHSAGKYVRFTSNLAAYNVCAILCHCCCCC